MSKINARLFSFAVTHTCLKECLVYITTGVLYVKLLFYFICLSHFVRKRLLDYANHKGIDQTTHPYSLNNAVSVNLLDSK